ncbi:MAG: prepilin-type N-terminal cleavage/methylation domain-containing protein [Candidatus Rokubacteria bacterium]|nr:prepilin-type N-terminal cleavage/methylation domain-containing protein [Candidatus Rokubacteria bacterium]
MAWKDQSGLTLAEILVAMAVITIALVAVVQWFPLGIQGMEAGRQQSTAVFLAEQKLEQIKAWGLSSAAGQGFDAITAGNPSTATCCAAEGYTTISGYASYRRQAIVTDDTANRKLVQVQVYYRPFTSQGANTSENQLELATIIARH